MFVTRKTYDAVVRERDEALALVAKVRAASARQALDHELAMVNRAARIACAVIEVQELKGELSRAYVHDARGRIARHPLNTGGKVNA